MSNERQADLLEDIARCLREGRDPLQEFQYRKIGGERWVNACSLGGLINASEREVEIRRKPRTIIIHTEIPEPVRKESEIKDWYFVPSSTSKQGFYRYMWRGSVLDKRALDRGQIHLTTENAIAHEKAMRPFGVGND